MPKDAIDRARKKTNRTGLVHSVDLIEPIDVCPERRKTRWGWAISELTGRCFNYASFGGGWPFTMGFRKHLYTKHGVCRRCENKRKAGSR